jgi:glucose/arabinose dehydrogenase/cytochrome c2
MHTLLRPLVFIISFLFGLDLGNEVKAQDASTGDSANGKILFQQSCALCHSDSTDAGGAPVIKQGPSLVDVFGRHAASGANFAYSSALTNSGLTWDAGTLDHFLMNPTGAVPGTTMPISVADAAKRLDIIAYLKTLRSPSGISPAPPVASPPVVKVFGKAIGDWTHDAPGVKYHFTLADLPAPFATKSIGNGPHVAKQPENAVLSVPPGFTVRLFAAGFSNPRIVRVAPNGDIFIAETAANRIRVLRAADGAIAPTENQIYVAGLNRPFGIAFYPPGNDPKWIYVANNNSVVRIAYHSGDLTAQGIPEVVVPKLTNSGGGHSTRDVAFSLDGKRMFISVGSGSNVAEAMSKKSPDDVRAWEAEHGLGAAWDAETNRADILVTDPEGHAPLHAFATGIRNGVGIAVNPETGDLWSSTNERDGLGDDLVPDYLTRVKEGGYYGWPWYYMGNIEDPRHKGERSDLAGRAIVPDVMLQSHSASLEMCFYPAASGVAAFPAEYRGDAFAALHGSWNRNVRSGYKVVRVRLDHGVPTGEYDDFLTGFVIDNTSVWGRPVGVAVAHDGALLVTEDGNGTVWRISYAAAR